MPKLLIIRFSKEDFENALPKHKVSGEPLWEYSGLKDGEHSYLLFFGSDVARIEIRSSVMLDGIAAPRGKNSIRCWLVDLKGAPLAKKVQKYVKRTKSWKKRLLIVLKKLAVSGMRTKSCPNCSKTLKIQKVKKEGPTKGRVFLSCSKKLSGAWKSCYFEWIPVAK
jgi:hypothetical protein